MKRRSFLKNVALGATATCSATMFASQNSFGRIQKGNQQEVKISLAQWSLHRQFSGGHLDPKDFARISMNTYGIDAIEYVNGFYMKSGKDEKFWTDMRKRAEDVGVKSLLLMVDDEGDLGHINDKERKRTVENHFKWVHAAKILGCHSIRVNAFGEGTKEAVRAALIDSMGQLSDYASREHMNVLIENHGLFSSNGKLIIDIVKQVNKRNFGTLPDFGNWCLSAKWGSTQIECEKAYDRYLGVSEFLPYAKSVSAKSYDFDTDGNETRIDYYKMLKIVRESGYNGYIGIEYEGERLNEHEGILATKALIKNAWKQVK